MAKKRLQALEIQRSTYRIELDKRWKLEELHQYTKNFEQAYYAYFALFAISEEGGRDDRVYQRVSHTLRAYPWLGGYSVVSFYVGVKRTIGRKNHPDIEAIKYASPGYMDLLVQLPVAVQIAGTVTSIAGSIGIVNKVYNDIYKGMRERKLNEIEVEKQELSLAKDEIDFLRYSCDHLADILKIQDVDRLIEMSGNELRALKVLQSIFRRVRVLANYQKEEKAHLSLETQKPEEM